MNTFLKIFANAVPVIIMVGLIPIVPNDIVLTLIYISIIVLALAIHRMKNDFLFLIIGFVVMTVSEYFFILTSVETFNRHSLFGIMPLWLPFLWAYGFVAIKRAIEILNH